MKVLISVIFFVFIYSHQFLFAQDVFGGNPASIHWRQYNTDTVRVIFPAGLDSQALRVARIVHYLNGSTGHSIGAKQRKINIIFQTQVTYENGFVALGPFRSEYYLYPPQDVFSLGSLPPDENLAIHEYRHVQQYMNFDVGFSKALSYILGEQGEDLGNAMTVPNWFFEGDAVNQETLVSQEGRGRLPSFLDDFKALWTGGRDYSWQEWRNGSYRSLVPNWYPLGYMLVAYGRAAYGTDIWKHIAVDAAAGKGGLYPFQKAVKRYTGLSFPEFREKAMDTYKEKLLREDTAVAGRLLTPLKRHNDVYYQQGFYTGEGDQKVVARASYAKVPTFWVEDGGRWHRIRAIDIAEDSYFSYRNGKITYAAYQSDPRWGLREFSDIRVLDIHTGKQVSITHRARYFSPDITSDGRRVVAVQVLFDGKAALHVLRVPGGPRGPEGSVDTGAGAADAYAPGARASNGSLILALPNPLHYFYVMPRWSPDDRHIVAGVRNTQGMMSLLKVDAASGESNVLLPFSFHLIAYPYEVHDTIYFSAQQGNGDQLMAYVEGTGRLYKLTGGIRSYYMPSEKAGELLWSTPAADGWALYGANAGSLDWNPYPTDSFTLPAEPLLTKGFLQDTALNALVRLDSTHLYPYGAYHKASHLLNFHSFRPYYQNPDWSFTVYGQNVLNTFQSQVGYDYNQNEQSSNFSAGATYGGWYPWLSGSAGYTMHRTGVTNTGMIVHWDEFQADLGTSIPFDFSYGRFYHFLTPSFSLNTDQLSIPQGSKQYFSTSQIQYADFGLNWSSQIQQATQQIFPHWAHSFTANYQTALGNQKAWQVLLTGSVYLPGLWNSHSLVLSGAYQRRDTLGHYTYTNDFPISRGYPGINYPEMWKWSANYHLPLCYPDWGFGSLVYFLRIRANLLYDNTQITAFRPGTNFTLRTTGLEVYFDTQWWNQEPVTFGIGYYRLLNNDLVGVGANQWQILLPILF